MTSRGAEVDREKDVNNDTQVSDLSNCIDHF